MQLTRPLSPSAFHLEQLYEINSDCGLAIIALHLLFVCFFFSSNVTVDLDVVREIGEDYLSK